MSQLNNPRGCLNDQVGIKSYSPFSTQLGRAMQVKGSVMKKLRSSCFFCISKHWMVQRQPCKQLSPSCYISGEALAPPTDRIPNAVGGMSVGRSPGSLSALLSLRGVSPPGVHEVLICQWRPRRCGPAERCSLRLCDASKGCAVTGLGGGRGLCPEDPGGRAV